MIEELQFATPLAYSPHGQSEGSRKSRELRAAIKAGDEALLGKVAGHVRRLWDEGRFREYFGDDVTLVPVPGHAPLMRGAVLLTTRIARSLVKAGLARDFEELVDRRVAVPKSAFCAPADRPTAQRHYETVGIRAGLARPRRLVLVDDVVTRGSMLLGSATRLADQYPGVQIRAFSLLRTVSPGEVEDYKDPCEGTIRLLDSGVTQRRP